MRDPIRAVLRAIGVLLLVLLAPGMLPISALARVETLQWSHSQVDHADGFRVHVGPASRGYDRIIDVGRVSSFDLVLGDDEVAYAAVTAYGQGFVESGYSNEKELVPANFGPRLLVSNSSSRAPSQPLSGMSVSRDIYVFVSPEAGIRRVAFYVDDPALAGPAEHIENSAPFDLGGERSTGPARPFDTTRLSDGLHTISTFIRLLSGGAQVISATFNVEQNGLLGEANWSEDFGSLATGTVVPGWIDTGADSSLSEDDTLFALGVGPRKDRALTTNSTANDTHSHYFADGSETWFNYEIRGRLRKTDVNGGVGVTSHSHYVDADRYYSLRAPPNAPFQIAFHPEGSAPPCGSLATGVLPVASTWYRFRFLVADEFSGTVIRAKIWEEDTNEPLSWQAVCRDSRPDRPLEGTIGAWSSGTGAKSWDDLAVEFVPEPASSIAVFAALLGLGGALIRKSGVRLNG